MNPLFHYISIFFLSIISKDLFTFHFQKFPYLFYNIFISSNFSIPMCFPICKFVRKGMHAIMNVIDIFKKWGCLKILLLHRLDVSDSCLSSSSSLTANLMTCISICSILLTLCTTCMIFMTSQIACQLHDCTCVLLLIWLHLGALIEDFYSSTS